MTAKNAQLELLMARIRRIQRTPEHYAHLQTVLDQLDPQGAPDAPLPTELPTVAPERWADRKDKTESVAAFVQRVWGPWLKAGLLTQGALRPLDTGLRPAIYKYCKVMNIAPTDIIPTRGRQGDGQEALRLLEAGDRDGALQRASIFTLATYASQAAKKPPEAG